MTADETARWIAFFEEQLKTLAAIHLTVGGSPLGVLDPDAVAFLSIDDRKLEEAINEFIRDGKWPQNLGASALNGLQQRCVVAKVFLGLIQRCGDKLEQVPVP